MSSPSKYSSETNPLGTQTLKTVYLVAANNFMIGQLNAHVILQQPDLDLSELDTGLATEVSTFQARIKKNAKFVLNKLAPGFITVLAEGANFSDLIAVSFSPAYVSYIINAHEDGQAAQNAHELASAIAKQAGETEVITETLNDDYAVSHQDIHQYVSNYAHSMVQAVERLGGSVKEISSEIDALQKTISECLEEIVKGGDEIGEGVTKLGMGILMTIAGAPKDPRPKTDPKPTEGTKLRHDSDDEDLTYIEEDGEEDDYDTVDDIGKPVAVPNPDFVVNAIKVSRDGQTRISEAIHTMRTSNAQLADAYQKMAHENVQMAMAKVIQVQTRLYLDGLEQLGAIARDLKIQWAAVASAYEEFGDQVKSVNDSTEATRMVAAAEGAKSLWISLKNQLNYAKDMMTGSV
mgnify:CR=1 FL=1